MQPDHSLLTENCLTEEGTIHHTCTGSLQIITLLMIWWCNKNLFQ
uniref:Translation initiation factor eIF-2B subunit beta-like n=1 Tax=Rhizophora mucronata TaxID=61149 RepID=A0A2P2LDW2_RHIMU